MSTSRLEGALARSEGAFGTPALALLHRKEGPLVVAVLSLIFTPGRSRVATEQMHVEVEDLLAEARSGDRDVPDGPARALCSRWVAGRWLVRSLDDEGVEQYQVSSHAAEALAFVDRTQGSRSLVSESRIRTLLVALDGLARDARPDRASQQAALREQIARSRDEVARAEAELARLEAGGPVTQVPTDRLVEQLDNVASLVRELPADFARVVESIAELQRAIVTSLRQDERATGEVLGDYLDASEHLMRRTPEGRAFAGAMEVLRDPQLLAQVDDGVRAVLSHPFAADVPEDRREAVRALYGQLLTAVDAVLDAQARASRTITQQLRVHNPLRDRELDAALREATAAMAQWFPASARAARVEPLRWFERARLGRFRDQLHDLRPETPPEALREQHDLDDHDAGSPLATLRGMGGPRYAETTAHVARMLAARGTASADEAFASAPVELRRPVELLGYLELAAPDALDEVLAAGDVPADRVRRVTTVRADGTTRDLALPLVRLEVGDDAPGARAETPANIRDEGEA
ncbi:DUF3375 domain-containing protein [Isoptericola sp. NEAU-Y5]|uniref:DUF3375 domain-containing protein n=1 Tax=Isoptericola luteus TaxID=2879484 RepID=A0ABS7ZFF7_9MICO|nr:DUF3375 domain-containing protein [Isoptericola sp. NEAU-Y5]MCA5893756.1 DUF3375 domain-containing protein [Isoptericola sp. NEAU-Y5]